MNENITKLGLAAGLLNNVDNETPSHYFIDAHADIEDVIKFAELIVKECISVAKLTDPSDGDDYRSGRHWAGIDIRNHFGV